MNRVKDKVALVTGGLRGLGLAVVERLCQEGAKVMFTDIDQAEGFQQRERLTGRGYEVDFEVQDVTQSDAWTR
jgi:NAD(P)-dependent dehydrogenase (short-subunit alcohol dehydrogenase family)